MKTRFSSILAITLINTYFALNTCGTLCAQTVSIGNQEWMVKNLDGASFRNGEPIPEAKSNKEWKAAGRKKRPAWCWYANDSANGAIYGRLYNWYAVADPKGLCPAGWHVPTDHDWNLLSKILDPASDTLCRQCFKSEISGFKMKSLGTIEAGTGLWHDFRCKNVDANNESGFTGFPGGGREVDFDKMLGYYGYWWSCTESSESNAWFRFLDLGSGSLSRNFSEKRHGSSVRCLKD